MTGLQQPMNNPNSQPLLEPQAGEWNNESRKKFRKS
jgi:hypothetical protein